MKVRILARGAGLFALAAILAGCVTSDRERTRLYRMSDQIVTEITLDTPGLQSELNQSAGYLVIKVEESMIPGIGGSRHAVLVDREHNDRVQVRISQLDFIGGDGVDEYYLLMLIRDREELDKALDGTWSYARDESLDLWLVYFKPTFGSAIVYDLNTMTIKP